MNCIYSILDADVQGLAAFTSSIKYDFPKKIKIRLNSIIGGDT